MAEKAKQFVKTVVGYPEQPIPFVTVDDYFRQYKKDPRNSVWPSHKSESVESLIVCRRSLHIS